MGCPIKGTKMSDSDTVTITPVNTSQFSHCTVQTFLANIINIFSDWLEAGGP